MLLARALVGDMLLATDLHHEVGEVTGELRIAHHLPARGQQLHVALDVEELLSDEYQLAGQLDVVGLGQRRELLADLGVAQVTERRHSQRRRELLQVLGGLRLRLDVAHCAHHHDDLASRRVILLDQQGVHELAK